VDIETEICNMGVKVFVVSSLKKKISISAFVDVYRIIKSLNIDIIHCHLVKPYVIAGLINIFLRRKLIFNYHGLFLSSNPYYSFFDKLIYRLFHILIFLIGRVDSVLVPSKKSRELLLMDTKLFPNPIVYYNGFSKSDNDLHIDIKLIEKIQIIKKSNIILALVGRLEIDKRIDSAIEILKSLTQQNINLHLLIFGEGSLKNKLQNHVQSLNLYSSIHFVGYVKGLKSYYKYFDILLFTSEWEGMPLSLWEAMANRVPIVAPDVGGFKEILEENNCGFIYESNNLKEAENKILELINDESIRLNLGQNGKSAIEKKYNEREFIKQIEKNYFKLMSE